MASKGNYPQMAQQFRLVNYYNLLRFMEFWLNDKIPKEDVITNIPWISNLHSIHIPVMFHWISDGRSIPQRYLRLMFYYVSLYQDYSPKYNIIKLWWFTQIDGTFIPWFIRLQPSFCCFNPKKWRSTLW
jgi:hypothetical protein